MFHQGARRFVFLSRSGTRSPSAKRLVEDLQRAGASVTVLIGNVTVAADVQQAVAQKGDQLGGVVYAAMRLDVRALPSLSR